MGHVLVFDEALAGQNQFRFLDLRGYYVGSALRGMQSNDRQI